MEKYNFIKFDGHGHSLSTLNVNKAISVSKAAFETIKEKIGTNIAFEYDIANGAIKIVKPFDDSSCYSLHRTLAITAFIKKISKGKYYLVDKEELIFQLK